MDAAHGDWTSLFDELETQLAATAAAELRTELADLTRSERAAIALVDRLRAHAGATLQAHLGGGDVVVGEILDLAAEWVLLGQEAGTRQALIPLGAICAVAGLPARSEATRSLVERRLGLGYALRGIARDRRPVRVCSGAATWAGTIDLVGADYLQLAVHPVGEPRRRGSVRSSLVVPMAALRAVFSA